MNMHNICNFCILKEQLEKLFGLENLESKRNEGMHLKFEFKDAHYCEHL